MKEGMCYTKMLRCANKFIDLGRYLEKFKSRAFSSVRDMRIIRVYWRKGLRPDNPGLFDRQSQSMKDELSSTILLLLLLLLIIIIIIMIIIINICQWLLQ